jgi:hypothetical protein
MKCLDARPAVIVLALLLVPGCGSGGRGHGGGGGGGPNPVPTITSLGPVSASADPSVGAVALTLTVNGTGFVTGSGVLINGATVNGTAFVSASQLNVTIPANALAASGTLLITVSSPMPGGGVSNAASFTVTPPTPALASNGLVPADANARIGGFVLAVIATNVMQNSVIVWNGTALDTTLATAPTSAGGVAVLSAPINNSLIASAGTASVTVMNPNADGSSGPTAAAENFTIGASGVRLACLLAGTRSYAFVLTGSDNNGAASMVGSFGVAGDGSIETTASPVINSVMDFKDPTQLAEVDFTGAQGRIVGGPGSCADAAAVANTGTVQFAVNGLPGTFILQYGLRANGNGGRVVMTNAALGLQADGQLEVQRCAHNCGPVGGSFAFGLAGGNDSGARYAVAGALCTGSSISFLQADFDDDRTTATASATGTSWGVTDASTGRAKSTQSTFMTGTSSRSLTLTLYVVDGSTSFIMDSTPIAVSKQVLGGSASGYSRGGACLATGQGGSFDNSAITSSVLTLHGNQSGIATAGLGVLANVDSTGGGSCPAGNGSAILTADFNRGGVRESIAAVPACYAISTAGRGVLSYTNPSTNTSSGATFYVDGFGSAFVIGDSSDIPFGELRMQASNHVIGGSYAFGQEGVLGGGAPLAISNVLIDSIATSFTAAGGGSFGAPYVLDATTGRGTLTVNSAATFGDTQLVFYVVAPRTIQVMDAMASAPAVGVLVQ